jgi:glutamate-ammonia-ligase adenylyltransferase
MRAEEISPDEADAARAQARRWLERSGEAPALDLVELGALIACAYPALAHGLDAHPEDLAFGARAAKEARDGRIYARLAAAAVGDPSDAERVRRGLRRFAAAEKLRIAIRELLAGPGEDVDVTSRELADLAEACCQVALTEALGWGNARFGTPVASTGEPCGFVVIGMGKLGGRELNAGSDIDLMLFYETDDGEVVGPSKSEPAHTLHEHFTRIAQRFAATLDEATDEGFVWRVDLRLRPEGTRGPLVNALAAAERYYETWGRTWERVALIRARPVAGDMPFGARLLDALGPFVWRKAVDPKIVDDLASLLGRARAEAGRGAENDLKIGRGGIREVEFFNQGLQLVWGGREPRVRATNTLDALHRLHAGGFVTEREAWELSDAYLFLRRLEHRIQFATGQQTHSLPLEPSLRNRLARSLGYVGSEDLEYELEAVRSRVETRFASVAHPSAHDEAYAVLWAALDTKDENEVALAAAARFGQVAGVDLPRHLLALSCRPDWPLGAATRDRSPAFAQRLVEALADAADPEQAARLLAAFFARLPTPDAYVRALADDERLVRAFCSLLGASAFLGESIVGHPDLVDRVLYARGVVSPAIARAQVLEEVSQVADSEKADVSAFVGALRRAKRRVTFEVGLGDLAGELTSTNVAHVLSELADAALSQAVDFALAEAGLRAEDGGLAVIAMGTLGGREIGYGSDLDIFFVYDARDDGAPERYARIAQRVLRLMETPHPEGPGYSLDTRLRPSGNQGLLVVSLEGFLRYQDERAESWERQALVKARACAGPPALGERVLAIAQHAAYERGAPPPARLHHLRGRMERELGHERLDRSPARYDLKVGRGGLVDIEFATQWLQMSHGSDPRVRTTETEAAIGALEAYGYLPALQAETLREGWHFLRRLDQRLRIAHGTSVRLVEEGAPGLATLARSLGMRDGPRSRADQALLERYQQITRDVRAAYLGVVG